MTSPKYVASTLKTMMESKIMKCILDRGCKIEDVASIAVGWWGYDLMSRKPSAAYDQYGVFQGTDLDLACFMYELAGRSAVINIPHYEAQTQTKARTDQKLKSTANRHGELINVLANKDFFSFNIRIIDQNVIGEDKVGDFRTFSLTNKDGSWYDGWKTLDFLPSAKENDFISGNAPSMSYISTPGHWKCLAMKNPTGRVKAKVQR